MGKLYTTKPGKKHEKDLIVQIWGKGQLITFKELAEICVILCKNEDNIYPPPAKGGLYLKDFLNECIDKREVTEDLLKKYKLWERD